MTASVVNGVLLAVILATWMWTWWWNRRVITRSQEPDYDAALIVFTNELVAWRARITHLEPGHVLLERPTHIMLYATRQAVARKVVDAAYEKEGNHDHDNRETLAARLRRRVRHRVDARRRARPE